VFFYRYLINVKKSIFYCNGKIDNYMSFDEEKTFDNNGKFYGHDYRQFQEIIDAFEFCSDLKVCILLRTHYEKKPTYKAQIFLERLGHFNSFCSMVKSSPCEKGCGGYDGIHRAKQADHLRRPFVDECPSGVIELIIPLIVRGEFVGTLFCGQVRKFKNREKGFNYIYNKISHRGCSREKLQAAYSNFKYYSGYELLKLGNLFFHALSNISDSLNDATIERAIKLQQNQIIKETIAILQRSENDFPSAGEISKQLGITQEYFSRLFKKVMNKNFITYITELRIARAQELLTNTTLPIIDIAAEVGYERQSYFTKKFREMAGMTPGQFRASSTLLRSR
jgi:AraC-like DNA-binding protein